MEGDIRRLQNSRLSLLKHNKSRVRTTMVRPDSGQVGEMKVLLANPHSWMDRKQEDMLLSGPSWLHSHFVQHICPNPQW